MKHFHEFTYEGEFYYIPERMGNGLLLWVNDGIYPCGFLTALLENDLIGALGRADGENMRNIPAYADYCYNKMPMICRGSKDLMKRWHDAGGLNKKPVLCPKKERMEP